MSVLFDDASIEYLNIDTGVNLSAAGFSVHYWSYIDDITSDDVTGVWFGNSAVSNAHYRLQFDLATGGCEWTARNTTGQSAFVGTVSLNTWHQFGGLETSTTNRQAVLDGTLGTANTGTTTFMTQNRLSIGRMGDSTPGKYYSGRIRDVAIWNEALGQSEWTALAKGVSPLLIRPWALVHYIPMHHNNYYDWISGNTLTANGTPVLADNNKIILPTGLSYPQTPAAVVGGNNGLLLANQANSC